MGKFLGSNLIEKDNLYQTDKPFIKHISTLKTEFTKNNINMRKI